MNVPNVEVRKVGNEETQELIDFLKKYKDSLRVPPEYPIKYRPWRKASVKIDSLSSIEIKSDEQIDRETDIATIHGAIIYEDSDPSFTYPTPYHNRRYSSLFSKDKTYVIGREPETQLSGEIVIERIKDGEIRGYQTGVLCSRAFSRMQSLVKRDEEKIDIVNLGNADIGLEVEDKRGGKHSITI